MMATETTRSSSILVVDDTPANLEVLTQMLKERGHRPRPVPSGALALRAAEYEAPDLILMDINMPEMDGFETCKRFKGSEDLHDIPVLFISARSESFDKIQAFDAGGVDYITKPFDIDEVSARIDTHLEIRALQKQLEDQYESLKELESMRDSLVHMIVHDMRSPLSVIKMALTMLEMNGDSPLDEEGRKDLAAALQCSDKLVAMVNNLLDVSRMEAGMITLNVEPLQLDEVIAEVARKIEPLLQGRELVIETDPLLPTSYGDRNMLERVLDNLVSNAVKFTEASDRVSIGATYADGDITVSVSDEGLGIPEGEFEHIFDKFRQAGNNTSNKPSSGLGLAFCKLAIEAHGGVIWVESEVGKGSRFLFRIPVNVRN